jgi:predicted nucleotidyltransferase
VDRFAPGTGSGLSADWAPVLEPIERWAGRGLEAILLSGSHATGEAVWIDERGRRVSLSDLDLLAVVRDDAAAAAAERARSAAPAGELEAAAAAAGLAAPVEVAFVTRAGLARLPARPGTLELARAARVLAGDANVLAALRRWEPADIGAEERLLLLENRAFELLWAREVHAPGRAGLRARHALLKVALELASSNTLSHGELPAGTVERVERARALGTPSGLPSWLEGAWDGLELLWEQALAWRMGRMEHREDPVFARSWRSAVRGWCAAWWAEGTSRADDPLERALALAARGSLARRWRRALKPPPGRASEATHARAPEDSILHRLRHAAAGTPLLRVHGTGVVLVLAAAQSLAEPVLSHGALRALRRLGVTAETDFGAASRAALAAWGRPVGKPTALQATA